jgi:hypothetical protein
MAIRTAMIEDALFVTGFLRSGTTLLEKLLGAQEQLSMLSQPFPLLFVETKRRFLRDRGLEDDPNPLGHLFLESRYTASAFAAFLERWRPADIEVGELFARMAEYSGQNTRFTPERIGAALAASSHEKDFASFVAALLRTLSDAPQASWFGSKETTCEEYVPALLERGFRCVVILRDPRDVVASLNHGRGKEFSGDVRPTLFNIRSWRKSVAFALAMEAHPRFHWCRYEDLAKDPARELERLAARLGLSKAAAPDGELRDPSGEVWLGNSSYGARRGVDTSSIGAWRDVLPPQVAESIEALCLPELHLLGYETRLTRADAIRVIRSFQEPYDVRRLRMERDAATSENAAMEIERIERVAAHPDADSARWFVFEQAHARLRETMKS